MTTESRNGGGTDSIGKQANATALHYPSAGSAFQRLLTRCRPKQLQRCRRAMHRNKLCEGGAGQRPRLQRAAPGSDLHRNIVAGLQAHQ